jgi:hypothetical protein
LDSRIKAENQAKTFINNKCGNLNVIDYKQLYILFNTERVPKNINTVELQDNDTFRRFQRSFSGNNPKSINQKTDEANAFIASIWKSDDAEYIKDVLDNNWRSCRITGGGSGFPTMILYLKYPERYNIWLPFTTNAIYELYNRGITFVKYKYKSKYNLLSYMKFNKYVNDYFYIHNKFEPSIMPQEIDYILYRVGKEKSG